MTLTAFLHSEPFRLLRLAACVLAAGYVAFVALAPLLASRALYHPRYGSFRAPEGMKKIPGPDGTEIAVLHLPNPAARFTLWFFHGNAEDLGDIEPGLRALRDQGFAVFASEYPGYGHSSGRPSEDSLYAAARVARRYLRDELHVPAEHTILWGRSLGGGPATQLATEERVGGLVLECAFTSAYRVATKVPLLPFDQFQNEKKLRALHLPVLVMHGTADDVIAFQHGEALFAAAPGPKRFLRVEGARHNDFTSVAGPRRVDAVREFSALCAQPTGARNP